MERAFVTVVETAPYVADAKRVLSTDEREAVIALLATDPECGAVIQGTGGVRKVRIGRGGRGKSGGARVVYDFRNVRYPVFLLAVFAKNERDNLSKAERNDLATLAKLLTDTYGSWVMTRAFEKIRAGLEDALAHARGEPSGRIVHRVPIEPIDVAHIRRKLGLSQQRFADTFGVSVKTVRNWEQGVRRPQGSARVLLKVIDQEPDAVRRVLERQAA